MILEEIKEIKSNKKELRKFGHTIGIALLVIGTVMLYFGKYLAPYFIGVGVIFSLIGLVYPSLLKSVHKIWMSLAVVMGFVMTRVILSILFYLVFTPMRFIALIFGKKFIDLDFRKKTDSYWNKREIKEYDTIDTERQF